jgi:tetratricopeptide (TPR) repeat protein
VTRAALAHLAAGEFRLSQHEPDKALEQFEAMEPFAGSQRDLLVASLDGRVYALLMKSEYRSALELIDRARKLSPRSANLAALSGWAHYRLNQMDAAITDLQTAQRLQPTVNAAALLEKAKRDQEAEGEFREGESSHFVLRYHGGASRQLASEVIRTLEEQFGVLKSELHYTPPEQIGVILYTQEAFRDVTRVPGWAGGLNDGRIRVPVQGMENVSDLLTGILKHELTHSFVFQKTGGRCPNWLQEGVAQWMEGRRTGADAAQLVQIIQDGKGKSLPYFEGRWMRLSDAQARFAYAWALAVVEAIEADSGSDGLDRLLDATRTESSSDAALLQALRTNFSSLDDSTVDYLRRTYLQ